MKQEIEQFYRRFNINIETEEKEKITKIKN